MEKFEAFKMREAELDYEIYQQHYFNVLDQKDKGHSIATQPGIIIHSDKPLNFTFLDLKTI